MKLTWCKTEMKRPFAVEGKTIAKAADGVCFLVELIHSFAQQAD